MNIEELLNKYLEGETSCDEERKLRLFFAQDKVPGHLQTYRPMFTFFEEESKRTKKKSAPRLPRRLLYAFSGIAAGVLIALAIAGISHHLGGEPENYVIIDGKCYTDARLIHKQARDAFDEVRFSQDEVFATLFAE